jgi:gliding motility-associated-like protein
MKRYVIVFIFQFIINNIFSQNEANVWYFDNYCGMDFGSGMPEVLYNGQTHSGTTTSTISDSLGNFLFCSDWGHVYSNNGVIDNGTGMPNPGGSGLAIVKWPGEEALYYLFTAANPNSSDQGFYYSIIDMKANNGLGKVIEKNILIEEGWDVCDRISVVKKENSENIWVIVRKNEPPAFASFLVDENGFNPEPVISNVPLGLPSPYWESDHGEIKVSPDKKYLVANHESTIGFEICRFHPVTGKIEYLYAQNNPLAWGGIWGLEFSPDSKYLYVCYKEDYQYFTIYQYDMQFISDSTLFDASAVLIGSGNVYDMQLARDGKIYCSAQFQLPEINNHYLSVIHNPWIKGTGCLFENNAISLGANRCVSTFPNFLLDFLFRFEWTGEQCQGYSIQFKPNFIPTPQTIQWDFDDGPGSNSWQLSPSYTFKNPGVHEIKVDVWYPSGRYEHTSREIEISPSPQPDLGSDTLICNGASIILNANCQADFFSWSTGQFGVSSITVSDSGTYWVKGRFSDSGCEGYDTIHVGFHTPTIIDETNLIIIPTTCNGASGSITGLTALGSTPYAYQWLDLSGNPYGTIIDATGLPAGQYQLTITDGNGCETVSSVYTIEDAGNLQVLNVELTQPHCGRSDGEIVIHAFSPAGAALQYSIDDGVTYQADSVFSGLFGAGYVVRVTDGLGCFGFYIDNPVILADIPGPQVTQVNVTDETDFLGNGAIEILASGSTPVIYYSIDSGATWQSNNGTFENVVCSMYYVVIKDENGCDTSFTVEVQNIILTYLHAVTGEDGICEDSSALIPVNVDNFNNVADFHMKLGYNADNLECEGFTNVNVQLLDSLTGWVDQVAGDIHLAWKSATSVTFPGTEKVADLVFTTKNPGQGELAWYTGETESYFTNSSGNPIPAEFSTGEVMVYEPPEIILDQSKTVCTGQFANLMSIAVGNQPPIDYRWIYPTGDTTSNDPLFFSVTSSDAGLYTLLATDRVGCTDQKSIELIVSENPVADFHGIDTLEMQAGDLLDAGAGLLSYLWNTGDSTESIVINTEGMYKVEMESPVGCLGSDSVYVKLTSEEIPEFNFYIPNAFTPDGDGVNDTFQAYYNGSNISHFTMEVYDRWGGRIFRSENILVGWDGKKNGKECPGGVYVYKIVFSLDGVPGSQERVGTVMLIR